MTYKTTQDNKDWIERTGSHATRPRVEGATPTQLEADVLRDIRVRRKATLSRVNAPADPLSLEGEEAERLALVMQQLGIEP
jgi:hypothetical protein